MARLSPHPFDSLRIGLLQTKLEQTAYSIKLAPIPSGDIKRSHSDAQPLPHICHVRWIHSHHNPPSLSPSKAAAAVRHTRSRVDLVAGDGRTGEKPHSSHAGPQSKPVLTQALGQWVCEVSHSGMRWARFSLPPIMG
ncbi:hypothetical protein OPV22_020212 [Ensete ventricosum]|uniref:Uncharacterized protein n=1 Tax=Ensete ventricosum TaxID=4639 RepID=A0AAV8QMI8_ENSVE|nr:hypothetical protein OPV22_020212 [Ensete ventricosum]